MTIGAFLNIFVSIGVVKAVYSCMNRLTPKPIFVASVCLQNRRYIGRRFRLPSGSRPAPTYEQPRIGKLPRVSSFPILGLAHPVPCFAHPMPSRPWAATALSGLKSRACLEYVPWSPKSSTFSRSYSRVGRGRARGTTERHCCQEAVRTSSHTLASARAYAALLALRMDIVCAVQAVIAATSSCHLRSF